MTPLDAPTRPDRLKPTNQAVGRAAAHLVAAELLLRGARDVRVESRRRQTWVVAAAPGSNRQVSLWVKSKRRGDWQTQTTNGAPRNETADETTFWVFVDLEPDRPTYRVVPAWWMQNDIHREHAAYLARHGGHRAETPDSTHHRIQPLRVEPFRDRFDLLGIFG